MFDRSKEVLAKMICLRLTYDSEYLVTNLGIPVAFFETRSNKGLVRTLLQRQASKAEAVKRYFQ